MMKFLSSYFVLSVACFSMATAFQSFADDRIVQEGVHQKGSLDVSNMKVKFSEAIILKPTEVKTYEMIQSVQQDYIDKKFQNYDTVCVMYIKDHDGRFIQINSLKNDDGKKAMIYFDMSDVYGNLKSKDKETREKIRELENSYMTIELKN